MDEWVKIGALKKQGVGIKKIARQLGVSKNTVRKYLRRPEAPGYAGPASKLEPYRPAIRQRVEQGLTGQRILREIRELGYTGGYSILTEYIRTFRPQPAAQATVRFETPPGFQAQVDWSDFGPVEFDGQTYRLSCFAMVLGWSRAQYIEFTIRQTEDQFLACHQHAFEYLGGVPRQILYDNLKSVVLSRCGRAVEFNRQFLDFAGYYGFEPHPCRPYWPRTKGKVERNFQYVEKDFFLGQAWPTLSEYNRQARIWLDTVANCRIHATTRERPGDRLLVEQALLVSLADKPAFDCSLVQVRQVSRDCLVSFEANRYSVPYRLAGQAVVVYADPQRLRIQFDGQWVAVHQRAVGKGAMVMDPQHYHGLVSGPADQTVRQVQPEFLQLGPHAAAYFEGLKQAQKGNVWYHAEKILQLRDDYSTHQIDQALAQALSYGAWGSRPIENICRQRRARLTEPSDQRALVELAATGLVRRPVRHIGVQQRDLTEYAQLAEGRSGDGD